MLLKALENCARQPSQIAIVTEAVHAAACLLRMSTADDAATGSRAEKTAELAKILIVESGADKQVRALNFALSRRQVKILSSTNFIRLQLCISFKQLRRESDYRISWLIMV